MKNHKKWRKKSKKKTLKYVVADPVCVHRVFKYELTSFLMHCVPQNNETFLAKESAIFATTAIIMDVGDNFKELCKFCIFTQASVNVWPGVGVRVTYFYYFWVGSYWIKFYNFMATIALIQKFQWKYLNIFFRYERSQP